MARPARLSEEEIRTRLAGLPGWTVTDGKLHREFAFEDFVAAFRFMSGAALVAERMGHHPDWCNSWNRVTVDLVTHDAGGLTALDFELASRMSTLAERP